MKSRFSRILGVGLSVVMLISTLVTAAPALADVSSASVSLSETLISKTSDYTIVFGITKQLGPGATINITLPSGTTVAASPTVTVAASPGWFGGNWTNANVDSLNVTGSASTRRITISLNNSTNLIGEGAQIRVVVSGTSITNPSAPGSYTLTVNTSNETTAVTSAPYTITLPVIGPLPGVITGKNSAGQILYQDIDGSLAAAIATPGVVRIELGSGTYNNTVSPLANQVIVGVGAAGTVIIAPGISSAIGIFNTANNVTFENLVINSGIANIDAAAAVYGSSSTTFRNCTFVGGNDQLWVSSASTNVTVSDCIFNVTGNVTNGITANLSSSPNNVRVTNSTFNIDAGGVGILTGSTLAVSGSTFTGSTNTTSTGISVITGSTVNITGNTNFNGLRQALVQTGGSVLLRDSTISGCGSATASTSAGVITANGGSLTMANNAITNTVSGYYALHVGGGSVYGIWNNFTGNDKNARQSSGAANITHNWWGFSTGPAFNSTSEATVGNLIITPALPGLISLGTGSVVLGGTSNMSAGTTSTGVDVSSLNATSGASTLMGTVAAARYAANPLGATPPGTPVAYYDVFVDGAVDGSTITIKFYTTVSANSRVYAGGALGGVWTEVSSQGVNTAGGYAYVTLTGATTPNIRDLSGTPFVVTNVIPTPAVPTLLGPAAGTTNIPTNTGFSWSIVPGAMYEFQVSTSSAFSTLTANVTNLSTNVYGLSTPLAANTTYFWRVRAMAGTGAAMQMSAWAVSTFTTAVPATAVAPPAVTVNPPAVTVNPPAVTVNPPAITVNPPAITVQAAPPANVSVAAPPPAQVTVNPPAVTVQAPPPAAVTVNVPETAPAIPTTVLWVIILIGAVLIIALIVLIVRTRRVA